MKCDVAIIGGGPAGSTVASLLLKYRPDLKVCVLEREQFPRDHVGESHLPVISHILDEMGVWDKVEAANFPIKVGANLKWGAVNDEAYKFYFIPGGALEDKPRPDSFSGQRRFTAFQVDRSVYDKILLDHVESMGGDVFQKSSVKEVMVDEDKVKGLVVEGAINDTVEASWYVDASGGESLFRKAFGVSVDSPTALRNIAIWDYWQDAEWAETVGNGGTYIQIMSFGWGWLWFIPITPTRTSVGLVTSAEYYKKSGKSTEEIYLEAIATEPSIREPVKNARREHLLQATKDWSYVSERLYGHNWFLAGDACGFADPILSAGMSLAHMGAKRVAYSLLALMEGELDPAWVKAQYQRIQQKNIRNHIRFADYWYSANGQFTDLQEYCREIAKSAGLSLDAESAFRWLGTGGFTDEVSGVAFTGTYRVSAIRQFTGRFAGEETEWNVHKYNVFELALDGSSEMLFPVFENGKITPVPCLVRGDHILPLFRIFGNVKKCLDVESEILLLMERFIYQAKLDKLPYSEEQVASHSLEALEAMVTEGWVKARFRKDVPKMQFAIPTITR